MSEVRSVKFRAEQIHPTALGSMVEGPQGQEYKFDGGLMAQLGMYDNDSGNSIPGTLVFIPDAEVGGAVERLIRQAEHHAEWLQQGGVLPETGLVLAESAAAARAELAQMAAAERVVEVHRFDEKQCELTTVGPGGGVLMTTHYAQKVGLEVGRRYAIRLVPDEPKTVRPSECCQNCVSADTFHCTCNRFRRPLMGHEVCDAFEWSVVPRDLPQESDDETA